MAPPPARWDRRYSLNTRRILNSPRAEPVCMISVAFTFSPAGGATDLEVEGRAFDGWASARYDDAPSEISEGGPHLVVELPVERFTPDGRGLVLWIGDD